MAREYEMWRDSRVHADAWRAQNNQCYAHFHSSLELVYVEAGTLTAIQNGAAYQLEKGQLLINSSYMVHAYSTPEHSTAVMVTIPLCSVPRLQATLQQNDIKCSLLTADQAPRVVQLMEMLVAVDVKESDALRDCLTEAALLMLVNQAGLERRSQTVSSDGVKTALRYIQEHLEAPLTSELVGRKLGYSPSRFSQMFNQQIGTPFTSYVHQLRCQKAEGLLRETDLTLTEIAQRCGFASMRTFHRVFKAYAGTTTRGIRKE